MSTRDAYGYTEEQYAAADARLDREKDDRMEREHERFRQQYGRLEVCRHCHARHDGTTRAAELHPDAPHARPSARIFVLSDGGYAVGGYHVGHAYDADCARRAANREAERLGIEVLP